MTGRNTSPSLCRLREATAAYVQSTAVPEAPDSMSDALLQNNAIDLLTEKLAVQ